MDKLLRSVRGNRISPKKNAIPQEDPQKSPNTGPSETLQRLVGRYGPTAAAVAAAAAAASNTPSLALISPLRDADESGRDAACQTTKTGAQNYADNVLAALNSTDADLVQSQLEDLRSTMRDVFQRLKESQDNLDRMKRDLVTDQMQLMTAIQHLRRNDRIAGILAAEKTEIQAQVSSLVLKDVCDLEDTIHEKEPDLFREYCAVQTPADAQKLYDTACQRKALMEKMQKLSLYTKGVLEKKHPCAKRKVASGKNTVKVVRGTSTKGAKARRPRVSPPPPPSGGQQGNQSNTRTCLRDTARRHSERISRRSKLETFV